MENVYIAGIGMTVFGRHLSARWMTLRARHCGPRWRTRRIDA